MFATLFFSIIPLAQEPVSVALRLPAGSVWRNTVRIERGLAQNSGETSFLMDLRIRWRCIETGHGTVEIEGRFVDWLLRLQEPEQRYEWHKGKLRLVGSAAESEAAGARVLFKTWSGALRRSDLRASLKEDGSLVFFHGLEGLDKAVEQASIALEGSVVPSLLQHGGLAGVGALKEALELSLSTPRPTSPITMGQRWQDRRELPALLGASCRLDRSFQLLASEQVRGHRVARLRVDALLQRPHTESKWIPAENEVKDEESFSFIIGSGLPYQIQTSFRCPSSNDTQSFFRVSIDSVN